MIVDEAVRGRGEGQALFREIFAITGEAGSYMVQLASLSQRHGANAFCARLGFEPVAPGFRYDLEGFAPT